MQPYSSEIEYYMVSYYKTLSEDDRRRYAAVESLKLGHGGKAYIKGLFSTSYDSIGKGYRELSHPDQIDTSRIRKVGGGAKAKKKIKSSKRSSKK